MLYSVYLLKEIIIATATSANSSRRNNRVETSSVNSKNLPTVVGHGENWYLCDGPAAALDPASTLVDRRQVGVHVAREATSAGHFLTSC